jgi:hypothetical protein
MLSFVMLRNGQKNVLAGENLLGTDQSELAQRACRPIRPRVAYVIIHVAEYQNRDKGYRKKL